MNDFDLYYQDQILPELIKFAEYRKQFLLKSRKSKIIIALSLIAYIVFVKIFYSEVLYDILIKGLKPSYYLQKTEYNFLLLGSIIFLSICFFYVYQIKKIKREFSYLAKADLYSKIIGFYPNLKYSPFSFKDDDESVVEKCLLFPKFDFLYSEDSISGKYKGINIDLKEILLTKIVEDRDFVKGYERITQREETIFKGLLLVTSMNKKFNSITYVIPNQIIKLFNNLPFFLKRVKLEDSIFEKKFDVYSDSQIEARYILTPSFMQRIVDLNEINSLRCCFIDNKLIIGIEHKDDFMPSLELKTEINYEVVKKVIEEIAILFNVIDTLKLDLNIGL